MVGLNHMHFTTAKRNYSDLQRFVPWPIFRQYLTISCDSHLTRKEITGLQLCLKQLIKLYTSHRSLFIGVELSPWLIRMPVTSSTINAKLITPSRAIIGGDNCVMCSYRQLCHHSFESAIKSNLQYLMTGIGKNSAEMDRFTVKLWTWCFP